MGFVVFLVVIWAAFMGAWFFVSKYLKSSDVGKIKDRLTGVNKVKKEKAGKGGPQSVIQEQVEMGVAVRMAVMEALLDPRRNEGRSA